MARSNLKRDDVPLWFTTPLIVYSVNHLWLVVHTLTVVHTCL